MLGQNIQLLHRGIDPIPLLKQIQAQPELFDEHKERQETPGSPHVDTQTIFLRWCQSQTIMAAFTEIPAIDYPAYAKLPEARPIVEKVLEIVGATELGRVIIPALKGGGIIFKHSDEGAYADHYERFHVCLQAARGNVMTVELEPGVTFEGIDPYPGDVFWFNHKANHMCVNSTKAFRLHMIIDAVAPKFRRQRVIHFNPKGPKLTPIPSQVAASIPKLHAVATGTE